MIIKNLQEIKSSEHEIDGGNWVSRRLLLKDDGMGFSLHDTIIRAGTSTPLWYKNHLEAVYCIEGTGEVKHVLSGVKHTIEPGTVYALNEHDRHILMAHTDMRMVCVFNPPLTGREIHDADGSYPLID